MQIDNTIIDEITQKANLVDVIGKHLKLKRSGANFFACCPFHKEKSPSLSINTVKQFFHCFGCGESGDVISFTMKYHGLDFIDAVKSLATEYNVHIPESTIKLSKKQIQAQKQHKLTLTETITQAVKYYQHNLSNNQIAFDYLKNRGLSNTIINQFALGFAPSNANNYNSMPLMQIFPDYTTNQYLIDAGLVIKTEKNKFYDRFRERIIFPIKNVRGEVIAFGGRIIHKGEPKYLNSPETVLFNKSQELYGLFEAQKSIRNTNYAIVVEGYMDVIALFQFGVDNVVATMGTAATEEHIKKLFRLCDTIYYCFDGDKAGKKAAWRALTRSIPLVTDLKTVYFTFLPNGHDPDSFIRANNKDDFSTHVTKNSLSLSNFLLTGLQLDVNLNTGEGRAKLISLAKPYIEQTKAMALQVMLKQQLAGLVNLAPQVLESILNNRSRYAFYNNQFNKNFITPAPKLSQLKINTLQVVVNHALSNVAWVNTYKLPDVIEHYSPELKELIFLLDFIHNNYNTNDKITLDQLKNNLQFVNIDIDTIYNKQHIVSISEEEFHQTLDKLLGFRKNKAIRVPKIPMRNNSHHA